MSKLIINGGKTLEGEVSIQGAKNSALPVLAATLLCHGSCVIHNCPELLDVDASIRILEYLGCEIQRSGTDVYVNPIGVNKFDIPESLMREMRSSIVFLGAIVARMKAAQLSFPGGCELGPRPIDLHLKALRKMGVTIEEDHGLLNCVVKDEIKGSCITLSFPSVGATENIILASVTAKGTTTITNAAREPEIIDLANFLNSCGAKIRGAGESTIIIEGVPVLSGTEHTVIPDRIVASTYLAAVAATGGSITLKNISCADLRPVLHLFEESGCKMEHTKVNSLRMTAPEQLKAVKTPIRTMPHPGFPTDAQAPMMAMLTVADGTSVFIENIFESRYKHVGELMRLGASINVEGKVAVVEGVHELSGAPVEAMDLRGAAALVIAGLCAHGKTEITGLSHLDRGYEDLEQTLTKIGADIKRV